MSTRVIPKANTVRTNFEKSVRSRVEALVEMSTTKLDSMLRAHFDRALSKGEEPYPPPHYQVELTLLQAKDFASGNHPEAQGAFENLAHGTPDGDKYTKLITELLQNAGFSASVNIDDHAKTVTVHVTDPEFTNWAYSNNVQARAQQNVQQTLADRAQRQAAARAKEVAPAVTAAAKQALKDALANSSWQNGVRTYIQVKELTPHMNDGELVQAACDLAAGSLSTKSTQVEIYQNSGTQLQVSTYFNSEQAFRGFMRTLEK